MRRFLENWLVIALFFVGWELAPRLGLIDEFFISRPSLIAVRIWEWAASGELLGNLLATFEEAGLGFLLGAVLGIALGLVCALNRSTGRALLPLMSVGNALPKLAFVPLLIAWFGFDLSSKVVLAGSVVFFFVFFGTYSGIRAGDPLFVQNVRMMGARRRDMLRHVYLPSTVNWLLASLRLAVAYAFAAAVVGEYLGANRGLGYLIIYGKSMMDLTDVFAGLVLITLIVGVLDLGLRRLRVISDRWTGRETQALRT